MLSGISALTGSPAITGASAITGAPTTSLFSENGIPLGKLPLQLLTMFPPTGYLGLNLSGVGMPITAGIKAASYGTGVAIGMYANNLYVNQVAKFLSYVLFFAPPWYIFDCIQILTDSKFDINGFQLPLPIPAIPSGGGVGGNWNLTFPLLSLILAATSISGLGLITFIKPYLPKDIADSVFKYTSYATGSGAAVFGLAALAGMFMQRSNAAIPVAAIPAAQTGGGKLPPLSSFINELQVKQTGGSKEAVPFIGILALIIVGGFSLNYLR